MSEKRDPWSELADEIGNAFLQSFQAEMDKVSSEAANADDMVEALAAHTHDNQWSGWMTCMIGKGEENADGSLTIPASWYWRWRYQASMSYAELPEEMKDSDHEEARAILRVLEAES